MAEPGTPESREQLDISKAFDEFAARQQNVHLVNSDPKVLLLGSDDILSQLGDQKRGFHQRIYYQYRPDNHSFSKLEELDINFSNQLWTISQYRNDRFKLLGISGGTKHLDYHSTNEDSISIIWDSESEGVKHIILDFFNTQFLGIQSSEEKKTYHTNIPLLNDSQNNATYDRKNENSVYLSETDIRRLLSNKKLLREVPKSNPNVADSRYMPNIVDSSYVLEYDEDADLITIKRSLEGELQDTITLSAHLDIAWFNQQLGINSLIAAPFTPELSADKRWRNIPLVQSLLGVRHIISPARNQRLREAAKLQLDN